MMRILILLSIFINQHIQAMSHDAQDYHYSISGTPRDTTSNVTHACNSQKPLNETIFYECAEDLTINGPTDSIILEKSDNHKRSRSNEPSDSTLIEKKQNTLINGYINSADLIEKLMKKIDEQTKKNDEQQKVINAKDTHIQRILLEKMLLEAKIKELDERVKALEKFTSRQ